MEILMPKVDWLTLSGLYPAKDVVIEDFGLRDAIALARSTVEHLGIGFPQWDAERPDRFYTWGFVDKVTGIRASVSSRPWTQGYKLALSGETLRRVSVTPEFIIKAAQDWPLKITRIDVAIDVFNAGFDTTSLYEASQLGRQAATRRTHSYHVGKSGATMYIGSRQSERMMRIYDKGLQTGTGLDWLRLEMEFKGKAAQDAALAMRESPVQFYPTFANFLAVFPHPLTEALYDAQWMDGEVSFTPREPRSPGLFWWHKQVIPAARRLAERDPAALLEVLGELAEIARKTGTLGSISAEVDDEPIIRL